MKTVQEKVPMFKGKTEEIQNSPSTKNKRLYTIKYLAKLVSCAFSNDIKAELENWNVETSSNALVTALNKFFAECEQTQHIFETEVQDLKVEEIRKFKDTCI